MLCAISGEAPQHAVASRKSGNVFEKRLIEQYIRENGTDPVNGEQLTVDDLLDLQQPRTVQPRPPTQTSIPALLVTFQNEWDALVLETYQLKQQLAETRQELSTALYYNDAAEKVIARLQKERDDAKDALSSITIAPLSNGQNGDSMQVDGQGLPDNIVARIENTQQQLSSTRRKRAIPEEWSTAEALQAFEPIDTINSFAPGSQFLSVDSTTDLLLCGSADGIASVYSLSRKEVLYTKDCKGGAVLDGVFWNDRAVIALSSGSLKVFDEAEEVASLDKHKGPAIAIDLHPCGDLVVSIGADKSFILYDLTTSSVITQVHCDKALTAVNFHPDGHLLAVGTSSGDIQLYDVKTLETVHIFSDAHSGPVSCISFSENGTWVASASSSETKVTIWDLRKTAELKSIDVAMPVRNITWDYTGQFLAVAGASGVTVQHYAKASKSWSEPLRKATDAVDVAWGPNARTLITLTKEGSLLMLG